MLSGEVSKFSKVPNTPPDVRVDTSYIFLPSFFQLFFWDYCNLAGYAIYTRNRGVRNFRRFGT